MIRFSRVPDGEVRVVINLSAAQNHYKSGRPPQLRAMDMAVWTSFIMSLNRLEVEANGKMMPLVFVLCIPFFVLLILGGLSPYLQELTWFLALFVLSFVVPFVIGGRVVRPITEAYRGGVELEVERMSPEFVKHGYDAEYVLDGGRCCYPDLMYVRFTRRDEAGAKDRPKSTQRENTI